MLKVLHQTIDATSEFYFFKMYIRKSMASRTSPKYKKKVPRDSADSITNEFKMHSTSKLCSKNNFIKVNKTLDQSERKKHFNCQRL